MLSTLILVFVTSAALVLLAILAYLLFSRLIRHFRSALLLSSEEGECLAGEGHPNATRAH